MKKGLAEVWPSQIVEKRKTAMLSMFALPKPFKGHIGVIQRNAIASWARLPSKPEIILFGDEEGTAQAARDLSLEIEFQGKLHQARILRLDNSSERGRAIR